MQILYSTPYSVRSIYPVQTKDSTSDQYAKAKYKAAKAKPAINSRESTMRDDEPMNPGGFLLLPHMEAGIS